MLRGGQTSADDVRRGDTRRGVEEEDTTTSQKVPAEDPSCRESGCDRY